MRLKAWARAGVTATLLLAMAGCGDDDGGNSGPGGITGQGSEDSGDSGGAGLGDAGDSQTLDLCSLLEESEVEAEFGERGSVGEGYDELTSCVWDVGAQSVAGSGNVTVTDYGPAIGQSMEEYFAGFKELAQGPVDLDDLGDEAYYEHDANAYDDRSLGVVFEHTFVYVRADSVFLSVSAFFGPGIDGVQNKLVTLAEHVLDRL